MKLPRLSGHEVIKFLSKLGYKIARQKGSHIILTKETEIRQSGLTREEFMELLKK